MAEPLREREIGKDSKNPNFLTVVLISIAALLLIFAGAYFVIGERGKKLVPPKHRDPQPTSQLSYPGTFPGRTSLS